MQNRKFSIFNIGMCLLVLEVHLYVCVRALFYILFLLVLMLFDRSILWQCRGNEL